MKMKTRNLQGIEQAHHVLVERASSEYKCQGMYKLDRFAEAKG
jgi:hypothetical protein